MLTEPTELDNGDVVNILPNGIKHASKVKSLLGNGVVLDPGALLEDFDTLSKNGIGFRNRLFISDRANIVTALHKEIANKIRAVRDDQVWLTGEDVT